MNRNLLILGEPGSGKTTMLLQLAKETIPLAEQDPAKPIPIVLNLSTWATERLSLAEWLVLELRTKYSIPKKVAQTWVEDSQSLLLLDGLDEVAQAHRNDCVEVINAFEQKTPLVVCSRLADYEALSQKLNLDGAVYLRPLTVEQIEDYLDEIGHEFESVRQMYQRDATFQKLVQSPLERVA